MSALWYINRSMSFLAVVQTSSASETFFWIKKMAQGKTSSTASNRCCVDVRPESQTLNQHKANFGATSVIWWPELRTLTERLTNVIFAEIWQRQTRDIIVHYRDSASLIMVYNTGRLISACFCVLSLWLLCKKQQEVKMFMFLTL